MKMNMEPGTYIRNLKINENGVIEWDVVEVWNGETETTHYHTNDCGNGLWIGDDYMHQKAGTFDFYPPSSKSGTRAYIKRWFDAGTERQKIEREWDDILAFARKIESISGRKITISSEI